MFFKNKSNIKIIKHIASKAYLKLSEEKKIELLMNLKNRGKLRTCLAVHLSDSPFENFAKSTNNLLELGNKFFEKNPNETLIKED